MKGSTWTAAALAAVMILTAAAPGVWLADTVTATGHATPPQVEIKSPDNGASVSGTVSVEVRAEEQDLALDQVDLFIGGGLVTSSTSGRFTYSWDTTGYTGDQTITATATDVEGHSASASITVTVASSGASPGSGPGVLSVAVNPDIVTGGDPSTGTVGLTDAAPSGGTEVTLASSNADVASVPASVTVPAGETITTFPVTTTAVASTTSVTITATAGGTSDTATLTVTAPSGDGGGTIDALTISPNEVVGGESAVGTATLAATVGADTVVTLTSSDETVATVPASVTVPAGALSATFTVTTFPNTGDTALFSVIQGHAGGVSRGDTITTVAEPSGPAITGITLSSTAIGGGGPVTGIVTFDAPLDDGVRIFYESSHPGIVQVPEEQQVIWTSTQRAFRITTSPVAANTDVTITATACCGGVGEATVTLTVTTDAPPAPDTVVVEKARWINGATLQVEATSTSDMAIIDVYRGGTDIFMLTLRPVGDGEYEGEQSFGGGSTNPGTIDVVSNLGGTTTAEVRE